MTDAGAIEQSDSLLPDLLYHQPRRPGHVGERARIGYAQLRRRRATSESRRASRASDALDDGDTATADGQPLQIEWHAKHRAADRVQEVIRRHIAAVTSSFNEHGPLSGTERLDDDLRLIPGHNRVRSSSERKEHRVATREHLRSVRELVAVHGDDRLRLAAGRRHAHNALAALSEQDAVCAPTEPEW